MASILDKFKINPEDENTYQEYEPRNLLAELVNPYLDDIGLPIPKISVADRKRHTDNITQPENAVLSLGMGGITNTNAFEQLAKKFGGTKLNVPKLDENLSKRISDAFKEMKHDPTNPEVKNAYDALIKETLDQYDHLIKSGGLKVDKIQGENPYTSSKDLINKVSKDNEIKYFPTDQGFGSGAVLDNPMLQKTGRLNASGDEMLANDVFRAVHDVYGHVKPGSSFGPAGEEIAYQNHRQMYSPEAQKALATETRGQNSFVNFGDNATHNRANPQNTIYADQKVGILPDFAINENAASVPMELPPISAFNSLGNLLRLKKESE